MVTRGGMQPHPEALYYHIAVDALEAAQASEDEFETKQHVAISLVFSALCLEAFINQAYEQVGVKRRGSHTRKHWFQLPSLLGAAETFQESDDLFGSYAHLMNLRDTRLVHFSPKAEAHSSRWLGKEPYFADLISDVDLAEGAVTCVAGMILELHRLTEGKIEKPSFLDGSRYVSTVWKVTEAPLEWEGPPRPNEP